MTPEQIRVSLARILEQVTDVAASEVTDDKSLVDDLEIDSLSMVEAVVVIEEEFGVSLPEEALSDLPTVGDLVGYLATATTVPA